MKAEKLYKSVIQRQINKGTDEMENSIIEMSLKISVIYGLWKEHEKAECGFKYCIQAQEAKMKTSKYCCTTCFLVGCTHRLNREQKARYKIVNINIHIKYSKKFHKKIPKCPKYSTLLLFR
jgi:hypothetical protein